MGKKIHGRKLAAPKTTKRRTKQKKTQNVKCLYFMGIYLARHSVLGPMPGADARGTATNSMVDCQTLRHYVWRSKLHFSVSRRN